MSSISGPLATEDKRERKPRKKACQLSAPAISLVDEDDDCR
jgi:hypothetical protein